MSGVGDVTLIVKKPSFTPSFIRFSTSSGAQFPTPISQIIFPAPEAASVQLYHNDFPRSCQRATLPSPTHSAFTCVTCGSSSSTANTHEQQHSSASTKTTQNTRHIIVETFVVE
ncbi:hypothetical protein TcG_11642 [Trypanosoma cruzi]|nr:hypothetical protein TcG_11642 [Trypanosoma cruzi]